MMLALGVIIYFVAWLFYLGTEKRTPAIRTVLAKLNVRRMPVVVPTVNNL